MKTLKGIDMFLQTGLVVIIIAGLIMSKEEALRPIEYLVALGAVQLISILVHLFIPAKDWKQLGWRKVHHIGSLLVITALIVIFNLEAPANSNNQYYGLGAIFFTSIVALLFILMYFIISWVEWQRLKKLP